MGEHYRFPGIPFGWYTVATSKEVKPGQVVPVKYFGEELILYRTESGVAHLTGADGSLGPIAHGSAVVDGAAAAPAGGDHGGPALAVANGKDVVAIEHGLEPIRRQGRGVSTHGLAHR